MCQCESGSEGANWLATTLLKQWIEATDQEHSRHLTLFGHALELLLAPCPTTPNPRLASACERWRYQVLRHGHGQLTAGELTLVNVLDLAANKAAGRAPREPRRTRQSISSVSQLRGDGGEKLVGNRSIREWLASETASRELVRAATELTVSAPLSSSDNQADGSVSSGTVSGRAVSLFAPIYLSSHCINDCPYCWFRFSQQIVRRHLTVEEVLQQAMILREQNLHDILLVAGDYPKLMSVPYLLRVSEPLLELGFTIGIEIAPQSTAVYAALAAAGIEGVTLYQETYSRALYAQYHPRGTKATYDWRLETLDRAAEAGMTRLGLGILLGLADPVQDVAGLIEHGNYLANRFPGVQLAFSLPRIHSAPDQLRPRHTVDDETLVRLYCLLRLAFPTARLVSSTRESADLRNRLVQVCVSRMSAGSKTSPGGYGDSKSRSSTGEQFPVADARPVAEVQAWLTARGYAVLQ